MLRLVPGELHFGHAQSKAQVLQVFFSLAGHQNHLCSLLNVFLSALARWLCRLEHCPVLQNVAGTHIPRLQVWTPVWVCMGSKQGYFSYWCFSPSHPHPLKKKLKTISLDEDKYENKAKAPKTTTITTKVSSCLSVTYILLNLSLHVETGH